MNNMFSGCKNLKELDLSSFTSNKLRGAFSMFEDCTSLELIDFSHFNECCYNKRNMFKNCNAKVIWQN